MIPEQLTAQVFVIGNALIDFALETDWDRVITWVKFIVGALCAGFVWATVTVLRRHRALLLAAAAARAAKEAEKDAPPRATAPYAQDWARIAAHFASPSLPEKRLALIEGDALVDAALREQGAVGDTVVERLMSPQAPRLTGFSDLMAAHRFRNELVHEVDVLFDPVDADRAFRAYEEALREMGFI